MLGELEGESGTKVRGGKLTNFFIERNLGAKKKRKGENKKFANFSLFHSVYQQLAVGIPASLMLRLFLTITLRR